MPNKGRLIALLTLAELWSPVLLGITMIILLIWVLVETTSTSTFYLFCFEAMVNIFWVTMARGGWIPRFPTKWRFNLPYEIPPYSLEPTLMRKICWFVSSFIYICVCLPWEKKDGEKWGYFTPGGEMGLKGSYESGGMHYYWGFGNEHRWFLGMLCVSCVFGV